MTRGSPFELDIPTHVQRLLGKPPAPRAEQIQHAWSLNGRSKNIVIKEEDPFTFHRLSALDCTDCIRGKVGYKKGLHIFEITWPTCQYGTNAAVGVGTANAPLYCRGYRSLVGGNEHSWGWDLRSRVVNHDSCKQPGKAYPRNAASFEMPDKFQVVLNMDEDYLGFIANGQFLGPAARGLRRERVYLMVSAVWGHCEVTMKYVGGMNLLLSLREHGRIVIRRHVISEDEEVASCQVGRPRALKSYLLQSCDL